MKIVFIGNSIVNGYPHKRSQCFVSLWRDASHHQVINKGVNGDTTPNVLSRFEKDVLFHKPDQVFVLGATNDFIYQVCTAKECFDHLVKMADLAQENSIQPILLTPLNVDAEMASANWIPDVDYEEVNRKLISLRERMLEFGNTRNIKIIDTQEKFRLLYNEKNKTDYLVDGIHPTVLGHQAMARFLQD